VDFIEEGCSETPWIIVGMLSKEIVGQQSIAVSLFASRLPLVA
jgi:hypothetical protein